MFKSFFDWFMNWQLAVDALKDGHRKDLKVKDLQIQDLENEIKELRKRRQCYVCGSVEEPLKEFGERMRSYGGFPSYFYCKNNMKCLEVYMDQLEGSQKA
jgi:hypothetical protein